MTHTDPADARRRTADGRSVVIIGGGFSGTMLAVLLLRRAGPADRVTIVEPRARLGHGLAYGATDPDHLLNVRARGMSAYPDDPDHFLRWLAEQPAAAATADPDAFLPRALYGAYVEAQIAPLRGPALRHLRRRAVAADPTPDGVSVRLDDGTMLAADALVLAFGNLPPQPDAGPYRGDPWAEAALDGLDPSAPVLILGTGLTMVDVAIALDNRGHAGPIRAVSRRGLVPRPHAPSTVAPGDPAPILAARPRLAPLLRALRRTIRTTGRNWRAVMDGLRPHLPALWHGLSDADRRRFLRHLRPWWDVHRHRLAPAAADRLAVLRAAGRLQITAGRVLRIDPDDAGAGAEIALQPRGTETVEHLRVARVIDCTGPRTRLADVADPLIGGILSAGHARPDPLELGLDTDAEGRVIGGGGGATPGFWALGPMTRPRDWEITAVPELRVQAAALAARLWPALVTSG